MTYPVTDTDDIPGPAAELIRRRAMWLATLSREERDGLYAMSLREVDVRFQAWMDAGGGVGDDGGG